MFYGVVIEVCFVLRQRRIVRESYKINTFLFVIGQHVVIRSGYIMLKRGEITENL